MTIDEMFDDLEYLANRFERKAARNGQTDEGVAKLRAIAAKLREQEAELEETRIKIRAGGEVGLGPYTLVPNEMFAKMEAALQAADELAEAIAASGSTTNDDVLFAYLKFNKAREGK